MWFSFKEGDALLWLNIICIGFFIFHYDKLVSDVIGIAFILSVLYSLYDKGYDLLGNIMVAYCVSITFIFGFLSTTNSIGLTVATLFTLSFFSNLGREITQGIADMEGDRVKSVRSVAIINGPHTAALLASVFYSITALFGPIIFLYLFNKLDVLRTLVVLISEGGFFFSIIYLLMEPTRDRALKTVK
ncbi:MAG: UbiA family prenyltransferase [Nitrososphaeria archaeon]